MREYTILITMESYCLLGSGEGWGSVIDTDIVFDRNGLPYFPARRLKGCLRESALEVLEMLEGTGLKKFDRHIIETTFGRPGDSEGAGVIFNNLLLPNHKEIVSWLRWGFQELNGLLFPETIIATFTSLRQRTSITKEGIAEDGSLRTCRVLKSGLTFTGGIIMKSENREIMNLIALSCANLRHVGTMRTRGYGRVKCSLKEGEVDLSSKVVDELEEEVG
ncbi:MAG TPA: hypothetical protein DDZ91_07360 [Firmicutes bacterium]|nr:hypothetical protein [Bacillota bacterium]